MRGLFLLCTAVLLCGVPLPERTGAQTPENPGSPGAELPPTPEAPDPMSREAILERDIATSSLAELADWCRSLGLSEGGSKEELAARLRSYFEVPAPPPPLPVAAPVAGGASKPPLAITINSARTTEYFTLETVKEEYIRLKGGVSVSLKEGQVTHVLKAEEILYNRSRNIMSASGGVEYEKQDGDTLESFRGEGITVNLNTWETVFMQGSSERAVTEGQSRYRFSGEVISRSGDDSTVLKNAEISNADDEEAYWSIAASKLWLLPGSDWAVFNAVLKVGEIPVLWLPYFYYPADEIVFHPVFGYKSREGTFVQTTTYLMGRPKAQGTSEELATITSIMGSGADMEKKLEGVFLRSTGTKAQKAGGTSLSIQADAYANLGFYVGSELSLPAKGAFGATSISGGIGISRDISLTGQGFTPFFPDYDGTDNWHSSRFFALDVPFRYRFIAEGSLNASGTVVSQSAISWSFPFYSDPYVNNDFMHRSEDSDIFTLLLNSTTLDQTIHTDSLGTYEWKLSGNLNFNLPVLNPYVTSLSLTSITSSLSFDKKNPDPSRLTLQPYLSYPPDSSFFYPKKLTLFSLALSVAGTPYTLGGNSPEAAKTNNQEPFPGFQTLVPPWDTPQDAARNGGPVSPEIPGLPSLSRKAATTVFGGQKFVMDYRLNPSAATEFQFNASPWKQQEDIRWDDMASQLYILRADGNLGFTLSENRGIYVNSVRFYGASAWQDYTYVNENAQEFDTSAKRETAKRNIHGVNRISTSGEYNFTLRPFYGSSVWSATNFQYALKGILAQTMYDSVNDSWSWDYAAWNNKHIELHRAQANVNAQVMDKTQSLIVSAELPPKESAVTGDATLRAWISESNARSRVRDPFEADPFFEPLYLTETLRFTDKIYLRQYAVYTPDLSDWTVLTTSLTFWELTASFTATRSKSYYLDTNMAAGTSGWYENSGEEKLNPQELRIAYNKSFSREGMSNIFTVKLNTGFVYDLRRYTYSKFTFNMGITARVTKLLDVTLSSYSENSEIYRYFKDHSGLSLPLKNPLLDLADSFRFDDMEKRRQSGFKLKSFSLDFVHHLGDWDATLGVKLSPELDLTSMPRQYRFNTTISFLIQWKPIQQLKTDIKYDKDGFRY
jgi:hypothetical protein